MSWNPLCDLPVGWSRTNHNRWNLNFFLFKLRIIIVAQSSSPGYHKDQNIFWWQPMRKCPVNSSCRNERYQYGCNDPSVSFLFEKYQRFYFLNQWERFSRANGKSSLSLSILCVLLEDCLMYKSNWNANRQTEMRSAIHTPFRDSGDVGRTGHGWRPWSSARWVKSAHLQKVNTDVTERTRQAEAWCQGYNYRAAPDHPVLTSEQVREGPLSGANTIWNKRSFYNHIWPPHHILQGAPRWFGYGKEWPSLYEKSLSLIFLL